MAQASGSSRGAAHGDTVKIHYTGMLIDGTVFDSSRDGEPLEFTLGSGQVIEGFEQAVLGMSPGESKTATIPAAEAYGPRYEEMVVTVERGQLPDELDPQVGQRLRVEQGEGEALIVTVVEASGSNVTLDGNHPLAGLDLTFALELVEIV
ncbi:MAG: peptidylprolyl isomerase [Verrucomicrobia bacterium]|nr:peptidylprolyl isomerase [Verrucomicrobiota bacterium]